MEQKLEIEVEKIFFEDQTVIWETVKEYIKKFKNGEKVEPIHVINCIHNHNFYLTDGHNRTAAAYLCNKSKIKAEVRTCFEECHGDSSYEPCYKIKDVIVLSFPFNLRRKHLTDYHK